MALPEIPLDVLGHGAFPSDGRLWWLRWLDGVDLPNVSGTPTVQALLTPLLEGTDTRQLPTISDVASDCTGSLVRPVHVGSLPSLRMGEVFLNGARVGELAMEPYERQVFGHSDSSSDSIVCADQQNPINPPSWWTQAWKVLPSGCYPLGRFARSRCLQLHAGRYQLLIPCSEVFRVFCAPESRLANALLSGPWGVIRDRVVNEAWNDQSGDTWRLGLRSGFTGRSAQVVAAYYWTAWARQIADMLAEVKMVGSSWRHLQAGIPYRYEKIAIAGEGLRLVDVNGLHRFLMLRIGSVSFPKGVLDLPASIEFRLDNYNTVRRDADRDLSRPVVTKDVLVPTTDEANEKLEVNPSEPPGLSAEPVTAPYAAVEVSGLPDTARIELEPPSEEERRRYRRTKKPTHVVSTGQPQRDGRGVGSLSHSEGDVPEASSCFGLMVSMLDRLLQDGSIDSWMPTVARDAPWRPVSGIVAWLLPAYVNGQRKKWSCLRSGRRRTCLVAEIKAEGRVIHLLEIEHQEPLLEASSGEAFRFALLEVSADLLESTVSSMLRGVVSGSGKWSPDTASRHLFIKHHFKDEEVDGGCGVQKGIPAAWALGKIKDFLGRQPEN